MRQMFRLALASSLFVSATAQGQIQGKQRIVVQGNILPEFEQTFFAGPSIPGRPDLQVGQSAKFHIAFQNCKVSSVGRCFGSYELYNNIGDISQVGLPIFSDAHYYFRPPLSDLDPPIPLNKQVANGPSIRIAGAEYDLRLLKSGDRYTHMGLYVSIEEFPQNNPRSYTRSEYGGAIGLLEDQDGQPELARLTYLGLNASGAQVYRIGDLSNPEAEKRFGAVRGRVTFDGDAYSFDPLEATDIIPERVAIGPDVDPGAIAPNFKQAYGRAFVEDPSLGSTWSQMRLLNSPSRASRPAGFNIGDAGCVLTSYAMILSAHGSYVTPGQLNEYLRQQTDDSGRLIFRGNGPQFNGGSLTDERFNAANGGEYKDSRGRTISFQAASISRVTDSDILLDGLSESEKSAHVISQLKRHIELYGPVMIEVPSGQKNSFDKYFSGVTHKIVAYATFTNPENGEVEILIRDPGYIDNNPNVSYDDLRVSEGQYVQYMTLREWQRFTELKTGLSLQKDGVAYERGQLAWLYDANYKIEYSQNGSADSSFSDRLYVEVRSPIDIVITDPRGRRIGFNPLSGELFLEGVDSAYFVRTVDAVIDDDEFDYDGFDFTHMAKGLQFSDLVDGRYVLEIFGLADGEYDIFLSVFSSRFGFGNELTFSGMASLGSYRSVSWSFVNGQIDVQPPVLGVVPEPGTWAMLICGFGIIGSVLRHRRHSAILRTSHKARD